MGTVKGNGLSGFAVFRCRRRSGCTRYFRNQVHHGQLPMAFLRGKRLPGLKPRDGRSARRGHPPLHLFTHGVQSDDAMLAEGSALSLIRAQRPASPNSSRYC